MSEIIIIGAIIGAGIGACLVLLLIFTAGVNVRTSVAVPILCALIGAAFATAQYAKMHYSAPVSQGKRP